MTDLINELELCLASNLYRIALNTALTIPDICSALESENGQTSGSKYKAWFDKYVSEKYNDIVDGEDIYKMRCASLHQGKLNHDYPRFEKILFQIPDNRNNIFHCNIITNALNLNIEIFIKDIISGYKQWKIENEENEFVLENIKKSIKLYPNGLHQYMVGMQLLC